MAVLDILFLVSGLLFEALACFPKRFRVRTQLGRWFYAAMGSVAFAALAWFLLCSDAVGQRLIGYLCAVTSFVVVTIAIWNVAQRPVFLVRKLYFRSWLQKAPLYRDREGNIQLWMPEGCVSYPVPD